MALVSEDGTVVDEMRSEEEDETFFAFRVNGDFGFSECTVDNLSACELKLRVDLELGFEDSCPVSTIELEWVSSAEIENPEKFDNETGLSLEIVEL